MLVIKNWGRMLGETFVDGRFLCATNRETTSTISFWFNDMSGIIPAGGVWVEINKKGHWNVIDKKTYYNINYPNLKQTHQISADWFEDFDNAKYTFEEALKQSK